MNSQTAKIQPRSRRAAHSKERTSQSAIADSRTKTLIRVPWLPPAGEVKPKPAARAVEPAPSPPPRAQPTVSATAKLPSVVPLPTQQRSTVRIDAAHSHAPAPHTAAPPWSRQSQNWLAKLPGRMLAWSAAIVSTAVLVVVLLRATDDNPKPSKAAPAERSAKKHLDETPINPEPENPRPADDRVAKRQPSPGSNKAKIRTRDDGPAFPAATTAQKLSTATADQPALNRRAGMNSSASIEQRPWYSSPVDAHANSKPGPANPAESFPGVERTTSENPPVMAAPPSDSTGGFENTDARSARLMGTIEPTKVR